jgi:hypothetical protein
VCSKAIADEEAYPGLAGPRKGQKWNRTMPASRLRRLLLSRRLHVHARGVRLNAVKITGRLDLRSATINCPLELEDCYFESPYPIDLDYAKISLLTLRRCHVSGGLTGDTLHIEKGLDLTGSRFIRREDRRGSHPG